MSEYFDRVVGWVEDEPLDLFSSLSGVGVPSLMELSDVEGKVALKEIRTARAQTVVNAVFEELSLRDAEAREADVALSRGLEDLKTKHRTKEEDVRADIERNRAELDLIGAIIKSVPRTPKELEKVRRDADFLELFSVDNPTDAQKEEVREKFMHDGPFTIDTSNLKAWLRENRELFEQASGMSGIQIAGRVSSIFVLGRIERWIADGTVAKERESSRTHIERPDQLYADAIRIKNIGDRVIFLTRVISILQERESEAVRAQV